ncbi:MAG TPA: carboxypeptidase M32 [Microvirga sp.]|jgi:carboxypeptidase Taq|nr:carboxypeptidase M32 [Microvirga sp.]
MSLEALRREIGAVNDLLCAASLLVWDSRTVMPSGGVEARGHQIATLMESARERLLAPATLRALDAAETAVQSAPGDDAACREVAAVRDAVAFHGRIPAQLIRAKAELRPRANAAWIEARKSNDFTIFAPHLAATIDLQRAYADAIGHADHPYDALLSLYEPGETTASVRALFDRLRPALRDIRMAAEAKRAPRTDFMHRPFPAEGQRRFGERIGEKFGYDFARGRLDFTVHPFEISFTRHDVRITMRRAETFAPPAIFGAFHEVGHGLYEQNVDPAYTRTALATDLKQLYAVGGTSFGAHESQSRLWENHVGRSRAFWDLHFADLRETFAPSLDDVDAAAFHRAVTAVRPGLVRTDADELTYDLHIMLRVEIEADLIAGTLKVADIPEAWNAAMRRDLGLAPPGDADGCLQDIHWSSGMFGSFCTYTIGNVMGAQLFETALGDEGIATGFGRGDYAPLHAWLKTHVWQHGRRFGRDGILARATGRGLEVEPYIRHLTRRYGQR